MEPPMEPPDGLFVQLVMHKNVFQFFLYPIGHLTHPPPSKVFLDFWNFFYLHGP